jgi:hypothetical protein
MVSCAVCASLLLSSNADSATTGEEKDAAFDALAQVEPCAASFLHARDVAVLLIVNIQVEPLRAR